MYNRSKYYKDYVNACIDARQNIHDNEEYNKCIQALNNWMDEQIEKERLKKNGNQTK